MVSIGAMYRRERPPEGLRAFAALLEREGFDELWVVEDCFWAGGMTAAAVALASTERITVGSGIAPAVARNVVIAAMDLAGLARMFPGRFTIGIGHGVAAWMEQIGALPHSQLAALEETLDVVRRMFAGERVTSHGRHVRIRDVELVFPPAQVPPVLVGATGPKSLDVAGRVADGLMLPEGSSGAYVRAAVGRAGQPAHCAVYALFAIDDDGNRARDAVAPGVDRFAPGATDRRLELLTGDGGHAVADPAERAQRYAIAGTAAECAAGISALADAGATSVVLVPQHDDDEQLSRAAHEVVPLLHR